MPDVIPTDNSLGLGQMERWSLSPIRGLRDTCTSMCIGRAVTHAWKVCTLSGTEGSTKTAGRRFEQRSKATLARKGGGHGCLT